ncbi:MAG: DUF6291 domain-containing protein [Prevotella sp.]|nr:DUF6291 domain-containing protein [Prevotella sp.]
MKKISLPTDLLVALAQLEDKDLALVLRAIISYANEGIVPTFTNAALKAFFSLFRSTIDDQRSFSEKQCVTNRENANRKKSPAKKKDSKSSSSSAKSLSEVMTSVDSVESDVVADVISSESESQPVVTTRNESFTLEAIEAVYPRLGSFRSESLTVWSQFSDETRKRAIDFVPSYLQQHPSASDQLYLNQYLKAQPWNN